MYVPALSPNAFFECRNIFKLLSNPRSLMLLISIYYYHALHMCRDSERDIFLLIIYITYIIKSHSISQHPFFQMMPVPPSLLSIPLIPYEPVFNLPESIITIKSAQFLTLKDNCSKLLSAFSIPIPLPSKNTHSKYTNQWVIL
jgi:hypothetical protein